MLYRPFGKAAWQASVLGFGCMRLPLIHPQNQRSIDLAKTEVMLKNAIDAGVNYLDTAYVYHDGESEKAIGKIITGEYRQKVRIASKLPVWRCRSMQDVEKIFDEQLTRLNTSKIDYYLLHSLTGPFWQEIKKYNIISWLERKVSEGKIGEFGFSFHDELPVFKEIIDYYKDWSFCQIQYNFMYENTQAGTDGLKYASDKGLSVVIMGPLLGGRLVKPPSDVNSLLNQYKTSRPLSDWALRWVWNHENAAITLSGMSSIQDVLENIAATDSLKDPILNQEELDFIDNIRKAYKQRIKVLCTSCGYCLPCPSQVNIPRIFSLYNDAYIYEKLSEAKGWYNSWVEKNQRGNQCTGCKECEVKCPQKINISQWMPAIHKEFA